MKKLFILLIQIASFFAMTNAGATQINLNPYQGGDLGKYIDGNSFPYNPGDTFVLSGNWNYCSMGNVRGTAANHVVFINDGALNMTSGFAFYDGCRYIDVIGSKTGSNFDFKIHNSRCCGVGITITGLTRCITVSNIEIYDKAYGMWGKNESNQTGCDSTQWYPHFQDSIIVEYCSIHDVNQEGLYFGSTDPSGSAAERAVDCYGKHFTPRSSALKDIFIRHNDIRNTGRTGIQLSALSFGKYEVKDNILRNNGFETSLTQWPNIWIGGEGEASGEISGNDMDSASRNNLTCYGNNVYIHDNSARHQGIARDINTGTLYHFSYYANMSVEIKPTHPYTKTTFKIKNNDFVPFNGYTPPTNNVSIYLTYNSGKLADFSDTGNYICNSGSVFSDPGIKYYAGCAGGDTTYDTIPKPCDSSWTVSITKKVYYDSVVLAKDTTIKDTAHYVRGHRLYEKSRHIITTWTYHLSKDSTYDTTYHCTTCGHCDSIIVHTNNNLLLGLMPFQTAQDYGIANTRDVLNMGLWPAQKTAIKRVRAYNPENITINLSTKNADGSPAVFYSDTSAYKLLVKQVVDSFPGKKKWVIENEEGNTSDPGAYYADTIINYCNEFAAALHQLNSQGITDVTNGGLIFIRYWYYDQTHDVDFYNNCLTATQRSRITSGALDYRIIPTAYEIDFLKNLPSLKKINIHQLYVSDTAEFAGLKRMIDYLKTYTGKEVTCNECGYYTNNINILLGLRQLAGEENFEDLIFYSGDGVGGNALPISESDAASVI